MRRRLILILGTVPAAAILAVLGLFAVFYVPDPGEAAPRVLVSVDRTLWNSAGLNRLTYVRKLRLAGLSPVLAEFPEDGGLSPDLFSDIDGLVLTGGGDVAAAEYGGDAAVTLNVNRDEPRFGLHRNMLEGHPVTIEPGSRLAAIYGTGRLDEVTTWHGQHVAEPGRGVVITAYSPDGIPEAIEMEHAPFMLGVQWHAEMPPWDEQQERLFVAFAEAVRAAR
jgi:gamma-glutamyl-gamma-aminobutyrate hydrolase PuuD